MEYAKMPEDLTPENFREFLATLPEDFEFAQDCDYDHEKPLAEIPWGCRCPIATFMMVRHPVQGGERWAACGMSIERQRRDHGKWRSKETIIPADWVRDFIQAMDDAVGFPSGGTGWMKAATAETALSVLDNVLFGEGG